MMQSNTQVQTQCDVFLDVKFEEDDHVLPLMSAVDVWENLRSTVAEDSLFEVIGNLLSVQVNIPPHCPEKVYL